MALPIPFSLSHLLLFDFGLLLRYLLIDLLVVQTLFLIGLVALFVAEINLSVLVFFLLFQKFFSYDFLSLFYLIRSLALQVMAKVEFVDGKESGPILEEVHNLFSLLFKPC